MLRFATVLLLFVAFAPLSLAQDGAEVEARTHAQVMPAPIGGVLGIAERVQIPPDVLHSGLHGTVIVGVVVEPDGSVSEANVLRGVHEALDAAALQAVLATPFEPGRQEGEAVRVRTAVPVQFALAALSEETGVPPLRPSAPPPPGTLDASRQEAERPPVYLIVHDPPELIGGLAGLRDRVSYPREARRAGARGTVMVRFVVDPSGVPVDLEVVQSVHPQLDAEALRAVERSRFVPGKMHGRAVHTSFTLPVRFR